MSRKTVSFSQLIAYMDCEKSDTAFDVHHNCYARGYANGSIVNEVFKAAFTQVQMHPCGAHCTRKTLAQEMNDRDLTLAEQKAWSQNLGHENFATTVSSYLPVSDQQQGVLIKGLDAG